ncbi:uncharacterized protein LOC105161068 [Sesamum indicum]|uniref:Uncharacterized protein LOC105161068 n=1 Tax=Sesamum indicum TaxID=4182 RepID=A0A6I9T8R7_SESIN|nr:uncharacterized protein LOC105161068 [Sesamum indicum]
MEDMKLSKKRVRDEAEESESDIDSPEVKRLRENLLDSLDDDAEFCTSTQDLDSFMKSFQEEIAASTSAGDGGAVDVGADRGESRPELGYLLEASDDELGLPPPTSSPGGMKNELTELDRFESDASEFGREFWEFSGYESFGLGLGAADNANSEYVALDGLFDYADLGVGSGDLAWRPETLPAQ